MYLCDTGHNEVAFESGGCPVCEVASLKDARIRELEKEVDDLEEKLDDLRMEVTEASIRNEH